MTKLFKNGFFLVGIFILIQACSPKIYRPPAMGAEYQFDRGLPPAKHPSSLFDKGMEEYLEKKGVLKTPSKHASPAPAKKGGPVNPQATSASGDSTVPGDTSGQKKPTTLPPANPVWPDSSGNGPR